MPAPTNPLTVLVVSGDPLARAGLVALLAEEPDLIAVESDSGDELPAALERHHPDVVLWDLGWQADEALDRMAEVIEDMAPVLALPNDEELAASAVSMGAGGALARDAAPDRLVAALSAVAHGLMVLDPDLGLGETVRARPGGFDLPPGEELTPRELEVLALLAEGLPNKAIAQRLEISEHTVKFHVNAIMGKLGAQSQTEAAMRAARAGLIHL